MSADTLRPVVEVIEEKCVNCHRCILACPAKMCNDGSGSYVKLNSDLCIGCGECISACSHGARKGIDDFSSFLSDLRSGKPIVAVVAPAIAACFDGQYLEVNGFLKALGVKAVFDASFGAELTVKSYLEYQKKKNPISIIAQPCPTLVTFIEIYRPELIPLLAPADSPIVHTMKMIRKYYREYEGYKIAAITPCYSKRREFDVVGIGDYNVTFNSIEDYLNTSGRNITSYPAEDYMNPPAERAVLFSTPGGLTRTVERYDRDIAEHTRKIEGAPEVYHYFAHLGEMMKKGIGPIHKLIDCLNCAMGCNGGPATGNRHKHIDEIEGLVEKRGREMRERYKAHALLKSPRLAKKRLDRYINARWEEGLYKRSYIDRSSVFRKTIKNPSQVEIQRIYEATYKKSKKDLLNCGACGYASCEQMAVAIINGLNKPQNCRHFIQIEIEMMNESHRNEMKKTVDTVYDNTIEKMNRNIAGVEQLSRDISETAACVVGSSAAIEQMVKNIQTITNTLEANAASVSNLSALSISGKSSMEEVVRLISDVSAQSESLIEASKVISDMASRTSVLGMNATIEAAHAGSTVGKGFAVVANEIRVLANRSGNQASSISKSLNSIKSLIDASNSSSLSAQSQFENIVSLTYTVQNEELAIKDSITHENHGGRRVLQSLNEINTLIRKIKDESAELSSSGRAILEDIRSLKSV